MLTDYSDIQGAYVLCEVLPDKVCRHVARYAAAAMDVGLTIAEMKSDIAEMLKINRDYIDISPFEGDLRVALDLIEEDIGAA